MIDISEEVTKMASLGNVLIGIVPMEYKTSTVHVSHDYGEPLPVQDIYEGWRVLHIHAVDDPRIKGMVTYITILCRPIGQDKENQDDQDS